MGDFAEGDLAKFLAGGRRGGDGGGLATAATAAGLRHAGRLRRRGGDDGLFVLRILGFRFGAGFLGLEREQALPVGNRDLVVVWVDFPECEEAVPAAAIFNEGGLQRGFNPHHFGEVDIAFQLPLR